MTTDPSNLSGGDAGAQRPDRASSEPIPLVPDSPVTPGSGWAAEAGRGDRVVPIARPAHAQPARGTARDGESRSSVASGPSLAVPPILELEDVTCPNCSVPLSADAVVCIACGYDLHANVVRTPEIGVAEVALAEEAKPKIVEFVPAGRGGVQPVAIAGAFVGMLAAVAAGISAGRLGGSLFVVASVLLVIYTVLVQTATGIAAVAGAAMLAKERFSRIDLVAARMLLAVAAFTLIISVPVPVEYRWLWGGLKWLGAATVYVVLIMILFKKDRIKAGGIVVMHAALWLLLAVGMQLAAWASAAAAVTPK